MIKYGKMRRMRRMAITIWTFSNQMCANGQRRDSETKRQQHACSEECTRDGNAEVATIQSFGREKLSFSLKRERQIREIQMEYNYKSQIYTYI